MDRLLARGALNFKFVDRTFNLSARTSAAILGSSSSAYGPGSTSTSRWSRIVSPEELRELVARFPDGAIQLEIGIQTFTPGVNALVSRYQDDAKAGANLRYLRDETASTSTPISCSGSRRDAGDLRGELRSAPPARPGRPPARDLEASPGTPIVRHEAAEQSSPSAQPRPEVLATDTVSVQGTSSA